MKIGAWRTTERTANKSSHQRFKTDSILDTRRKPTARKAKTSIETLTARANDERSSFRSGIGIMEDFGNDILTEVLRRRWMSISTEQEHGEMVYTLVKKHSNPCIMAISDLQEVIQVSQDTNSLFIKV